jgi:hypothetical protein
MALRMTSGQGQDFDLLLALDRVADLLVHLVVDQLVDVILGREGPGHEIALVFPDPPGKV